MREDILNNWAQTPTCACDTCTASHIKRSTSRVTTSQPIKFAVGTGGQLLSSVLESCLSTNQELIIVTCFWATSKSQQDVSSLLRQLSIKALSEHRKIRVRLCFSSISIMQKLFQTSSLNGKIYPSTAWEKMGLPSPSELLGLELVVKSMFVRPFSVMHPKFLLVDRQKAFMPSCNVSFEEWFEGFIEMRGDIAGKLFEFWISFWGRDEELALLRPVATGPANQTRNSSVPLNEVAFSLESGRTKTVLLPSPFHKWPHFKPLSKHPTGPPSTPLNTFLLQILDSPSNSSIFIQTPNLTCHPLISVILSALARGVDLQIITSRRLMILEQLVTAGTITEFEVWKLRRSHVKLLKSYERAGQEDPESTMDRPGSLKIGYFKKKSDAEGEPVKSHLKCVIVDEEITILGSGNMDRASWYTSQELGIAFFSREVARDVRQCIDTGLEGRVEYIC